MLSKLGAIIPPFLRQAESTDTHQYIRQHEREQGKRKGSDHPDDENDGYTDEASVSIDALLLFLESMASAAEGNSPKATTASEHEAAQNNANAQSSPSLYAAHAYAHAAKTSPRIQESPPAATITDNPSGQATHNINSGLIDTLISEIRYLKSRGIKELHIERSDTFASSLFQAIEKAKAL